MAFESILFSRRQDRERLRDVSQPEFFVDLNLDQLVASVVAGKEQYDLVPFFHVELKHEEAVSYRHVVMRDLEKSDVHSAVIAFAGSMEAVRKSLAAVAKLHYERQKQSWFLQAVATYCDAIGTLNKNLAGLDLGSQGMRDFRDYVRDYVDSAASNELRNEIAACRKEIESVRYALLVRGDTVAVRLYDGEEDYTKQVEETFAKFRQNAPQSYLAEFRDMVEMNHIEAGIVDRIAALKPQIFESLATFFRVHQDFIPAEVSGFEREIQFYLAWLNFTGKQKKANLPFCYPRVSTTDKAICVEQGYDLTLADKLVKEDREVVCNDVQLSGKERIIVVSGPNQGGKTTFARAFGQLHYIAALGLTVPASEARLFLYDRLFTHFERQEDIETLRGKLKDDLVRIHEILEYSTPNSLIVMNEIFNSTTTKDALFLSRRVIERIIELDLIAVCVTFIDEVARMNDTIVSMVSTVVPDNPAERTFRIERHPADGLAYAISVAEKYRLTYDQLKERVRA